MDPAEVYERRFVPALFGPWGPRIADLAAVAPGHRCLDVACGTGALTRALVARTGDAALVTGLDAQAAMLDVARRHAGVTWVEGDAHALPFADHTFDRVVSQFGFMFFEDPVRALREVVRVCRPGGRIVVATCAAVERSPGYAVLTEVLHRVAGASVAEAFRAPFALGTEPQWQRLVDEAGLTARVAQVPGEVRFGSIRDLVETERACAWTLGGQLDDAGFEALLQAAEPALRPFVRDGAVHFDMPAIVVTIQPGR